ncbi:hypothetical protein EDB19DRAFT_1838628 [Suillus lakei]|nr:hypothetical protein EDB19DRAFT_1838628 [Suillus lakei]
MDDSCFQHSLDRGSEDSAPPIPNHLSKIMMAGHSLEKQIYIYIQFVALLKCDEDAWAQRLQEAGYIVMEWSLYGVSLDKIKVEDNQQDALLKCTIDTILSNYIAAQHQVHQYAQYVMILKREEDAWAQRFQKASCAMPDYEPARIQ